MTLKISTNIDYWFFRRFTYAPAFDKDMDIAGILLLRKLAEEPDYFDNIKF